jgi:hypothetical protein
MMSRDGDKYEFVETLRRRLYLNDVSGQGLGPRRHGGVVSASR